MWLRTTGSGVRIPPGAPSSLRGDTPPMADELTDALATTIETTRRAERDLFGGLDDAARERPIRAGDWNPRDFQAHLTAWKSRQADRFAAVREERELPPMPGDQEEDAINAALRATRVDWTWSAIVEEADAAADRLAGEIRRADPQVLRESDRLMSGTFGNGVLHALTHFRWLLEAGVPLDRSRVSAFEDEALCGQRRRTTRAGASGGPVRHRLPPRPRRIRQGPSPSARGIQARSRSWWSSAGPMTSCSAFGTSSTASPAEQRPRRLSNGPWRAIFVLVQSPEEGVTVSGQGVTRPVRLAAFAVTLALLAALAPATVLANVAGIVENTPPTASTIGPAFVPVSATASRYFLWEVDDVDGDELEVTVGCGSGTVVGSGEGQVSGTFFMLCRFTTAGSTLVGPQATDDDGASVDGRIPVVATTAVRSISDGRIVIDGPSGGQSMGGALAAVDLDADGKADIAIGSSVPQWLTPSDPGTIPVIRGRSDTETLNLGSLPGGASWAITGPPDARFGSHLAAAGDVNGDGRGDLLVGSLQGAWVVFGRPGFTSLDVRTMAADRGFEITGMLAFETGPQNLAGVGDVNGDGFGDVAVGSPSANSGDGEVAVILGRASPTDIDVSAIPAGRGFTIEATPPDTGWSIAGGDINADGRSDVAVASRGGWDSNVLVVFGRAAPVNVDQSTMTAAQGFTVGGGEGLGVHAVAVGDLDRDGYADLALAHNSSTVTVVRGGATNASVPYLATATGTRFATISGAPATARLLAADLTDDGYADFVIGATGLSAETEDAGSAYTIRGGPTVVSLDLDTLNARWTRIDGDVKSAWAGAGLASADVTGDGVPDLVVGGDGARNWQGDGGGRIAAFAGSQSGDVTAPAATAPVAHLASSGTVHPNIPVRLTWTGSDGGTGLARFELQRQVDGGGWVAIGGIRALKATTQQLAAGHAYRFRVRAQDGSGNWSGWKYGPTFTLAAFAESSPRVTYAGAWSTSTWSVWWGGKARFASATGASATLTFTGREVIWVAARGPDRGTARIYINGVLERSIDVGSQTATKADIVFRKAWATSATRSIRIVVTFTPSRHRIDVDGFAVLG